MMLVQGKFLNVIQDNRDEIKEKYFGLSVSKVKTFKQCKAKYHFNYIKKLPRKEWEHLIFGKFLHEVLERFEKAILGLDFGNKLIPKNELPDHILMKKCFSDALVEWNPKMTSENKKESFDILCQFLEKRSSAKKAGVLPEVMFAEKDFNIDIGNDVMMNGFIDVIQRDVDGILHVADYKTSKSKEYLKKDWMQLKVYAYVMCLEDPNLKKVRCSYIMLRHKFDSIVKEFSRDDVMGMEQEFRDYAKSIHSEKLFRPTPSPLCQYCDYVDYCEDGQDKLGIKKQVFGVTDW